MAGLITTTLLSGIEFLRDCPPSWKSSAFISLKNMLSRVWTEPTRQIKRGIDFENKIYKILKTMDDNAFKNYSDNFRFFLEKCKGGITQKITQKLIKIEEKEYLLYGKIDIWFPDFIIDIKTTENYSGEEKYLKTSQHEIYCLCEKIQDFTYLVAVFDGEKPEIKETHTINYFCGDFEAVENNLKDRIKHDLLYLQAFPDLFDFYEKDYCKK